MTTNVYGNGSNSTQGANTITHFYDRAGIKAANAVNVYQQFASKKFMPKRMGKTFKISKFLHIYDRNPTDPSSTGEFGQKGYLTARDIAIMSTVGTEDNGTSLNTGSSLLSEGAGAVNKLKVEKITVDATLARYGNMIEYTDEVELFSEDAIQVRYREELGEFANRLYEDLIQFDMLATPTVMFAGDATDSTDIGDSIAADGSEDADYRVNYDLIRKAVQTLTRNRAKKNTSIVTGSNKVGTAPVAAAYYAIIGPEVKYDLENLTRGAGTEKEFAYVPVHKYGSAGSIAEGEVGAMHEVRFVESEAAFVYEGQGAAVPASYAGLLHNDGTNFNVYPILFPSQDAFATVGLKGMGKIKFNSKAPSEVGLDNPYGTKGFFSFNFFYAGLILEEEKLLKVMVAAGS